MSDQCGKVFSFVTIEPSIGIRLQVNGAKVVSVGRHGSSLRSEEAINKVIGRTLNERAAKMLAHSQNFRPGQRRFFQSQTRAGIHSSISTARC